jgi:hypothetical protein
MDLYLPCGLDLVPAVDLHMLAEIFRDHQHAGSFGFLSGPFC